MCTGVPLLVFNGVITGVYWCILRFWGTTQSSSGFPLCCRTPWTSTWTSTHLCSKPTSEVEGRERPTSEVEGGERPTSEVEGRERPTSEVEGGERPSSEVEGGERPSSEVEGEWMKEALSILILILNGCCVCYLLCYDALTDMHVSVCISGGGSAVGPPAVRAGRRGGGAWLALHRPSAQDGC